MPKKQFKELNKTTTDDKNKKIKELNDKNTEIKNQSDFYELLADNLSNLAKNIHTLNILNELVDNLKNEKGDRYNLDPDFQKKSQEIKNIELSNMTIKKNINQYYQINTNFI